VFQQLLINNWNFPLVAPFWSNSNSNSNTNGNSLQQATDDHSFRAGASTYQTYLPTYPGGVRRSGPAVQSPPGCAAWCHASASGRVVTLLPFGRCNFCCVRGCVVACFA
jgi:hypothetical protein